ncbi:MAG: VWA domain-containing protein [Bacteroidales bacterium]|nr:VWA domain-containing protein [Bacteroidales bacterium]
MHFAHPGRLWLIPAVLIPLAVWYYFKIKNFGATLKFGTLQDFGADRLTLRKILAWLPPVLNFFIISLIIIAIARPQTTSQDEKVEKEGIDIIISMDISGSMEACDFKPNRLEAGKNVACEFIQARENDRIGIVLFAGESFTQCPLTTDRATLVNLMTQVKNGIIDDGTAIGMGLANAVARIKDSDAKSKVIILLTDGMNNSGEIEPISAAEIAATYGIRVYTIGIGTNGTAPYPVTDIWGHRVYEQVKVEIDESTLQKIAKITDGKYFRATNNQALKNVYEQIDQLEKTKMLSMTISHANDLFHPFLVWALVLMALNVLIRITVGAVKP